MNLSLVRWLRLVAPPTWTILVLLMWCAITEGVYGLIVWYWGWQVVPPGFFVTRDAGCLFAAILLGMYRITAFHPQFDSDYLSWLWLTPWKYDKPLPRGPIHLVPQDLLAVGLLMALMLHDPVVPPILAPLLFLISYYLLLALSLWCVDLRLWAYALSALVGLSIAVAYRWPEAALGLAALIYLPAYASIRWTLSSFPWTARATELRKGASRQWQVFTAGHRQHAAVSADFAFPELEAQWPFNLLHAIGRPALFSPGDRVAIALLTGWWAWVLFSPPGAEPVAMSFGAMFYMSLLVMAVAVRLHVYCHNYRWPISLAGRVFTLRWVIPGYDKVYLTPLATLGLGLTIPYFLIQMLAPALILAVSIPPFLLAALLGGPPLSQWRLTCPARLTPGMRNQQRVEEI